MDSPVVKQPAKRKSAASRARRPSLSGEALASYVAERVAGVDTAVTQTGVAKLIKASGHVVDAAELVAALEQLVTTGRAFHHPSSSRTTNAYGREPAQQLVARCLQQKLQAGGTFTLAQLRAAAPREYKELIAEGIDTLLQSGKLFEKPGGGKTKAYTTTPLPATAVLTPAQRKALQTILTKLNAARRRPLELAELLEFLDGPAVSTAVAQPALTLEQLKEFYQLDLPARGGLSSMPIPMTWRRYFSASAGDPDRDAFEHLLLESAAHGRIELTAHEWPATLAAEDLEAALRRPDGRVLYYWRPLRQP